MSNLSALVTGASSGIGFEACQYLLEEGYTVFGASRSGSPLDHENYVDIEIDIRVESEVIELFSEISEQVENGLNLIVQCAGVFDACPLVEMESKVFRDHLDTNVLGAFHLFKHLDDMLIEGETHFITLLSVASQKGFPNVSAYCASKFALKGLVDSVKEEWKTKKVRFTNLFPGPIDTPMWDEVMDELSEYDRGSMLNLDDFISVFDMIIKSAPHVQFPDVTFLHESGGLEP
jgi:NAD(P)-dependent dehydrogenase (short-subunit alcohol dehydrogenase family)